MAIVLDGTTGITTPDLTDSSLTSGRVVYAGTGGNLTGSAGLIFDGTENLFNTASGAGYWLNASGTFTRGMLGNGTSLAFRNNGIERFSVPLTGGIQSVTSISVGNETPTTSGFGITFPSTQSASSNANTLDDYEEGTFTATMTPLTSGSITLSASTGSYTKIGRQVTVTGQFNTSAVSSPTGRLRIGGFPFTVASGTQFESRAIVGVIGGVAIIAIDSWVPSGGNFIDIYPTGTTTDTYASNIDASTTVYISATYFTT